MHTQPINGPLAHVICDSYLTCTVYNLNPDRSYLYSSKVFIPNLFNILAETATTTNSYIWNYLLPANGTFKFL